MKRILEIFNYIIITILFYSCSEVSEFRLILNDKTTQTVEYSPLNIKKVQLVNNDWSQMVSDLIKSKTYFTEKSDIKEQINLEQNFNVFIKYKSIFESRITTLNNSTDLLNTFKHNNSPMIISLRSLIELEAIKHSHTKNKEQIHTIKNKLIYSFKIDPYKSFTTIVIIATLIELNEYNKAEILISNFDKSSRHSKQLAYYSALIKYKNNEYLQAKQILIQLLQLKMPLKNHLEALVLTAKVNQKIGLLNESDHYIEEALNLSKYHSKIRIEQAKLLMESNRLTQALDLLSSQKKHSFLTRDLIAQIYFKQSLKLDKKIENNILVKIEKLKKAHILNKANIRILKLLSNLSYKLAEKSKRKDQINEAIYYKKMLINLDSKKTNHYIKFAKLQIYKWINTFS